MSGRPTGETRWRYEGTPPTWTPRVQGGVVFVARSEPGSDGGRPLVALDASTGAPRWTFGGASGVAFTPTDVVRSRQSGTADAVVCVASTDGVLWALDDAGTERWWYALDGRVDEGPVFAGDRVYVQGTGGLLRVIDVGDGTAAWTERIDTSGIALSADADGVVLVAATASTAARDRYRVLGVAADGSERFDHDGTGGLLAAVARDGDAYVVTDGGHLAGFGEPSEQS